MTENEAKEMAAAVDIYGTLVEDSPGGHFNHDNVMRALRAAYRAGSDDSLGDMAPLASHYEQQTRELAEMKARPAEVERLLFDHVNEKGGI